MLKWDFKEPRFILTIDPGLTSGCAILHVGEGFLNVVSTHEYLPDQVLELVKTGVFSALVVEDVVPYGIASKGVLALAKFIGQIQNEASNRDIFCVTVPRPKVGQDLTGIRSPSKASVNAAVQDRYALGIRNKGKGTKKEPGPFYGVAGHMWCAIALGAWILEFGAFFEETPLATLLQGKKKKKKTKPPSI